MTDKQFQQLSRAELVDIIYALKKKEEELTQSQAELQKQLDAANQRLQERETIIKESGSIAEASMELHGVFQAAQAAADEYLAQVKNATANIDAVCQSKLDETNAECERLRAKADQEIQKKWDEFNGSIRRMLDSQAKLRDLLNITSESSHE